MRNLISILYTTIVDQPAMKGHAIPGLADRPQRTHLHKQKPKVSLILLICFLTAPSTTWELNTGVRSQRKVQRKFAIGHWKRTWLELSSHVPGTTGMWNKKRGDTTKRFHIRTTFGTRNVALGAMGWRFQAYRVTCNSPRPTSCVFFDNWIYHKSPST
jgi:hypothetical protein